MQKRTASLFLLIVAFSFIPSLAFCQVRLPQLKKLLESADTVLVASHYAHVLDEKTDKELPLFIKNKLNPVLVVEKVVLSGAQVRQLSTILSPPPIKTPIKTVYKCFDPHHVIVMIHARKVSYIDICFECKGFSTSRDIRLEQDDIDKGKLVKLAAFFKKLGLRYEL